MIRPIKKILIANRSEIAVRIMRCCRDVGIKSVAVYSECDATALHVRMADEAYPIGRSSSSESYLVIKKIVDVARECGADAIHPGYGFLAENAQFAEQCGAAGIIFIGPRPETIRLLGDKLLARETALKAGLPVVPGTDIGGLGAESALAAAREIGFPVLVKAAAGGGGKGMRVVSSEEGFAEALESAGNEAQSAFGDRRVFIERYLPRPRHIEIQILCDQHGNCIHLGERECSIQRRHQKVIEESPSPVVTEELRARMGQAAVNIARTSGYVSAGTVEFMVDQDLSFYFLEVNTRLQVEHPVTEMVTGLDLVKEQIAVAEGRRLEHRQEDIALSGHAIECRIYAENPEEGFIPSTGILRHYRTPEGAGVRVDSGVLRNSTIPVYYDPMIAKLIVWGKDRQEAVSRTRRALHEYQVGGVNSTIGFHRVIMDNRKFLDGDLSTRFLEEEYPDNNYGGPAEEIRETAALAAALDRFAKERKITLGRERRNDGSRSNWLMTHRLRNLTRFGGSR
jgi:acetyl-CoA carboxylase biotin carboxylase subunit